MKKILLVIALCCSTFIISGCSIYNSNNTPDYFFYKTDPFADNTSEMYEAGSYYDLLHDIRILRDRNKETRWRIETIEYYYEFEGDCVADHVIVEDKGIAIHARYNVRPLEKGYRIRLDQDFDKDAIPEYKKGEPLEYNGKSYIEYYDEDTKLYIFRTKDDECVVDIVVSENYVSIARVFSDILKISW